MPVRKTLFKTESGDVVSFEYMASDNTIPQMTSNITPSGKVTASSEENPAYRAFDGSINDSPTVRSFWYARSMENSEQWIKYEYPEPKIIGYISIITPPISGDLYGLKNFWLYGSNNDVDYDLLLTGVHPNSSAKVTYAFANSTPYKYYRLNGTSYYGRSNYVAITDMEMMERIPISSITTDNQTENIFLNYGTDISMFSPKYSVTKNINIKTVSQILGTGKTFEHVINLQNYKVEKIKLS